MLTMEQASDATLNILIQEYAFETVAHKTSAILFRSQCVKNSVSPIWHGTHVEPLYTNLTEYIYIMLTNCKSKGAI